jgi:hypothetical protein
MMMPSRRAHLAAVLLACSFATVPGRGQQAPGQTRPEISSDIDTLIKLSSSQRRARLIGWSAASRLQKLGPPAADALAASLRQDVWEDGHGNLSPIEEALAKMGEVGVAAIDRALTPALLASTGPSDPNRVIPGDALQVGRSTHVLARMGADLSAPTLVRIARTARHPGVRELALAGLIGPNSKYLAMIPRSTSLEFGSCESRSWTECPFDSVRRLGTAVQPVLGDIANVLRQEPDLRVRVVAAEVLVRWGEGALRAAGEQELIALAARDPQYIRRDSIVALGRYGVEGARDLLRQQAALPDDRLGMELAEALVRMRDPASVPLVTRLMATERTAQWAIEFAGRSRDVAFVPSLIDRVGDTTPTGRTDANSETVRPPQTPTVGSDALAALRALTFQDFGPDPAQWRAWWASNRDANWQTHLTRFVAQTTPKVPASENWVTNEWMDRLAGAPDPAVLPFVVAYLRHPRLYPDAIRPPADAPPGRSGDVWVRGRFGVPPVVVTLLLELVGRGSVEARQL